MTPANCCVEYYVRSATRSGAAKLWRRVLECFEGAAIATGCEVRTVEAQFLRRRAPARPVQGPTWRRCPGGTVAYGDPADFLAGSADMGSVSYEVPSLRRLWYHATKEMSEPRTGLPLPPAQTTPLRALSNAGRAWLLPGLEVLTDDAFAAEMKRVGRRHEACQDA